jgi:transposase
MTGFIEGVARGQSMLFPDRLEDWICEDSLVRVVELFVDELDLAGLGFMRSMAARTGRPGYHPAVLLKLFIYGYLFHPGTLHRRPAPAIVHCKVSTSRSDCWIAC